jgi:hypothetical protein
MNEPIYTFVKGEGWIPLRKSEYFFKTRDGKTYSIETRVPTVGEPYDSWPKDHEYNDLGFYIKDCCVGQASINSWPSFREMWDTNRNYITLVPCD